MIFYPFALSPSNPCFKINKDKEKCNPQRSCRDNAGKYLSGEFGLKEREKRLNHCLIVHQSLDVCVAALLVLLEVFWILEINHDGVFLDVALLENFFDNFIASKRTLLL